MGCPIVHIKGSQFEHIKLKCTAVPVDYFIPINSADPVEYCFAPWFVSSPEPKAHG